MGSSLKKFSLCSLKLFSLKKVNRRCRPGHHKHGDKPEGFVKNFHLNHIAKQNNPKTNQDEET